MTARWNNDENTCTSRINILKKSLVPELDKYQKNNKIFKNTLNMNKCIEHTAIHTTDHLIRPIYIYIIIKHLLII